MKWNYPKRPKNLDHNMHNTQTRTQNPSFLVKPDPKSKRPTRQTLSITLATGVHAKIRLDILTLFRFRIYYGLDIGFAEEDFADVVQNPTQLKIEHKINSRSQFERGPCFERGVGR